MTYAAPVITPEIPSDRSSLKPPNDNEIGLQKDVYENEEKLILINRTSIQENQYLNFYTGYCTSQIPKLLQQRQIVE